MAFRVLSIVVICMFLAGGCATPQTRATKMTLREIPREQRVPLMVLNFRNTTLKAQAEEYQPWEFGIPSMVMTDLESIGIFNILSWEKIEDILEQQKFQQLGMVREEDAVELGRLAAARYILTGSFMVMNGILQIEATAYSVEKGTMIGAASVNGEIERFFELEKELVIEMTSYLGAMLTPEETARLAGNVETRSVEASLQNYAGEIKVYEAEKLEGEGKTELAEKHLDEARKRFEAALEHDPAYERAKRNLSDLVMAVPMTL